MSFRHITAASHAGIHRQTSASRGPRLRLESGGRRTPAIAPLRQSRLSELKVGNLESDFSGENFCDVSTVSVVKGKLLLFFCAATEPPESKMAVRSFQVAHQAPMLKIFFNLRINGPHRAPVSLFIKPP